MRLQPPKEERDHTQRGLRMMLRCDVSLEFIGPLDDVADVRDYIAPLVERGERLRPGEIHLDLSMLYRDVAGKPCADFFAATAHRIPTEHAYPEGIGKRYTVGRGYRGLFEWWDVPPVPPSNDRLYYGGSWEHEVFNWSSDRRRMRTIGWSWPGPPTLLATRLARRFPAVRLEMSPVTRDLLERPRSEEKLAALGEINAEFAAAANQ